MSGKPGYHKSFGTTMMRELKRKANDLGINVDWHTDSEGTYFVDYGKHSYPCNSAASACHFIIGMMSIVASPVGDLLEATWVKRPLVPVAGPPPYNSVAPPDNGIVAPKV